VTPGPTPKTCPEDIKVIHVEPEDLSGVEFQPLQIKSRDLSSVVLSLSNLVSKTVTKVYVEFLNGYYRQCLAYDYSELSTIDSDFTVQCMQQVPLSIVTVYVVDETVWNSPVVIPECCHADPPPGSSVAKYTFKIYCTEQCPEDE